MQSQIPEISGSHEPRGEYQGWEEGIASSLGAKPLWQPQHPRRKHGRGDVDELPKSRTFIDSKGKLKTKTARKEATTHN